MAKANAEKTRTVLKSEDTIAVIQEFQPRFEALATAVQNCWREIGALTAELIEACNLSHDADGRKQFNALMRLMTLEPYVAQVAGNFASVYMADVNLESVSIDKNGKETRKYADDARGLKAAAKDANVALGISRKREKKIGTETAKVPEKAEIWPLLAEVMKSQAGRAEVRRYFNTWGYEVTPMLKADVDVVVPALVTEAVMQANESRKVRKAA